jgi:crotonobetainyl-CoA:carnitine CoA-transferase CaiB-like acyl-CoA transferase
MQGIVPKMSETPGEVKWSGPELGEHNEEVYCGKLKLSKKEFEKLQADNVI